MAEGLRVAKYGHEGAKYRKWPRDTAPFQLWDDLGCPSLHGFHPISSAIFEVHWKRDQKRQGIIPLSECHIVGELPRG